MKRLISVVLAVSLLGTSVAAAGPYRGPGNHRSYSYGHSVPQRGYTYGYGNGYRYRDHDRGNAAAAVGLGILAFGLIATLAAQNHDRDYYAYDNRYAPPPGSGYGAYGYGGGYGGYGYGR